MGLEQAIAENTAAIRDLIAISTKLHDLRADAIEKVTTAASASTKPKDKPAETKKADEPKPNISANPEDRKDPNDNPYEGVKELIAGYLTGTDREEERTARKEKIKALLNHEKIVKAGLAADRKPDVSDIRPESVDLFKDQIAKLTAKGDITTPPASKSDDLDL